MNKGLPVKKLILLLVFASFGAACIAEAPGSGTSANNGGNNGVTPPNNGTVSSTVIDPNSFPKNCEFDDECALVHGGDVCGCFDICPSAINIDAVMEFEDQIAGTVCKGTESYVCPASECEPQMAICKDTVCTAVAEVTILASDFDQECERQSECRRRN
jgi:hypothetical protein